MFKQGSVESREVEGVIELIHLFERHRRCYSRNVERATLTRGRYVQN